MPPEKEGVRQVSGEPRSRAGEPEQDADRGAESTEGHLLPQGRVAVCRRQGALDYAQLLRQKLKGQEEGGTKKKRILKKLLRLSLLVFSLRSGATEESQANVLVSVHANDSNFEEKRQEEEVKLLPQNVASSRARDHDLGKKVFSKSEIKPISWFTLPARVPDQVQQEVQPSCVCLERSFMLGSCCCRFFAFLLKYMNTYFLNQPFPGMAKF